MGISMLRMPIVPRCTQCMRQNLLGDVPPSATPFYQQLRGKRTARRPDTIQVKLSEDVRGYGPSGSIVTVSPGRMRNVWHPRQVAEYVNESQLGQQQHLVAERDRTFGREQEGEDGVGEDESEELEDSPQTMRDVGTERDLEMEEAVKAIRLVRSTKRTVETEKPVKPVKLIRYSETETPTTYVDSMKAMRYVQTETKATKPSDPTRATELMMALLPPQLVFYRTPISNVEPSESKPASTPSNEIQTPDPLAALPPTAEETPTSSPISEPVTSFDIVNSVRLWLAKDDEARSINPLVSLTGESVRGETGKSIKEFGVFPVQIRVTGSNAIRREIVVKEKSRFRLIPHEP